MTPYENVFKSFLSKIQDDTYIRLSEEVIEDDLITLMNAAISDFRYPKVNLKNKNDMLMQFDSTLGLDEVEILAQGMVVHWLGRQLRSVDALRQNMTTKDFNTYSQASHINALVRAEKESKADLRRKMIRYSQIDKDGATTLRRLGGGD